MTSTSIAFESGSSSTPTVAVGPSSAGIQAHVCTCASPFHTNQLKSAARKATAIAAIETAPAACPRRRSGTTTARSTNATKGRSTTRSAMFVAAGSRPTP